MNHRRITYPVPFQLVLAWHPANATAEALVPRIRARYHGDDRSFDARDAGINTGTLRVDVEVRRCSRPQHDWGRGRASFRGPAPLQLAAETLALIVVFIDHHFAAAPGYVEWLEDLYARHGGKCVIFPVAMSEGDTRRYADGGGHVLTALQGLRYDVQPEAPLRPPHLMLRIAYEACRLLAGKGPRVFLSHAKADGLPLVQSMRSLIHDMAWLPYFYDVKDLAPGQDWREELRRGVREGALLILRTGVYDGREWCREEVEEALRHQVPIVAVEAFEGHRRDRGPAYLNNVPVVRVTDGDLFRPIDSLLREQLRCLVVRRTGEQLAERAGLRRDRVLVLVRPPELADLFRFEASAGAPRAQLIVYPGPALPRREHAMLQKVVRHMFDCPLVSTDDFYGAH